MKLGLMLGYSGARMELPVDLVKRRTYQEISALLLSGEIDAAWIAPPILFALFMGAHLLVHAAPRREMIRSPCGVRRFLALWSAFTAVFAGLVAHNGLAALSGLLGRKGEFMRTPKRDTQSGAGWRQGDPYLPTDLGRVFALRPVVWFTPQVSQRDGTAALGPVAAEVDRDLEEPRFKW